LTGSRRRWWFPKDSRKEGRNRHHFSSSGGMRATKRQFSHRYRAEGRVCNGSEGQKEEKSGFVVLGDADCGVQKGLKVAHEEEGERSCTRKICVERQTTHTEERRKKENKLFT